MSRRKLKPAGIEWRELTFAATQLFIRRRIRWRGQKSIVTHPIRHTLRPVVDACELRAFAHVEPVATFCVDMHFHRPFRLLAFFVIANDDTSHMKPVLAQLQKYEEAKRPVEVHIYAKGGHGFNMGKRSKLASIHDWPQRMADWMGDNGYLKAASNTVTNK